MDTIIGAVISAIAAIVVCIINTNKQSEKQALQLGARLDNQSLKLEDQLNAQTALINQKLEVLSERVEKHNNVIERTFILEQKAAVQEEKMKVANNRIDDLEDYQKKHQ